LFGEALGIGGGAAPSGDNRPQITPETMAPQDTEPGFFDRFRETLPQILPHLLPMQPGIRPQSFAPGQNGLPAMAATTINNTWYVEQIIGPNADAGGLRTAQEGLIRETLLNRRLTG
jgi:hypothetical protein